MATAMLAPFRFGHEGSPRRPRPVGPDQGQLDQVAEGDDADEEHHHPLDVPVAPGQDEGHLEHQRDDPAGQQGQAEQQPEAQRPAQQLGDVGGDAGHDDGAAEQGPPAAREALAQVVGEAVAGDDADSGPTGPERG